MNHRERVMTALSHQEPDRVPMDLGGSLASSIVGRAYPALRKELGLPAHEAAESLRDLETVAELQAGVTTADVLSHWDGKNGVGQMLPDGVYAYEASGVLYSHNETAGSVVEQILGVTSPKTGEITLDNTKPTISATQDPPPNAAGWNNTDVVVTFSAEDNLSGVAEVTQPVMVSEQGKDIEVNGKAVDKAGNEATLVYKVNIDKTPPALTATQEPLPNAKGWNKTDVIVTFQAEDELSGLAEVTGPVTVTEEAEDIEVPGSATDWAGNTSYAMPTVSIDKTAPQTAYARSHEPNKYGWNNTDVKLTFQPTDALSGVAHTYVNLDDAEAQDTTELVVSDEGEHTVKYWSLDEAGNAEAEKTTSVNIDKTPPKTIPLASVTFDTPARIENGVIIVEQSSLRFRAPIDVDVMQALAFANNPALTVSAVIESVRVDVSGMQAQKDYVVTVRLIDKADNKSDSPIPIRNIAQEGPVDTDGDGIPDQVEIAEGLDPNDPSDANGDADGDCLTNLQEYRDTHTDINNPDTDGDGLTDGCDEYNNGLDPLDPTGDNGPYGDLDGDGHTNAFELEIGTQPNDAGSGLSTASVRLSYWSQIRGAKAPPGLPPIRELYVQDLLGTGQGGMLQIEPGVAFIPLPAPFKATAGPVGVSAGYPASLTAKVPRNPAWTYPVNFSFEKACFFMGQAMTFYGGGQLYEDHSELDENGQPIIRAVGGGSIGASSAEMRKTMNKDGQIPLPAGGLPEIGAVEAVTTAGQAFSINLSDGGYFSYQKDIAPLWTDVDMEIEGMQTVGTSVRQNAPPYFVDPDPGTVVKVTLTLEGYKAANAVRSVYLSWPEACFTATDQNGSTIGNTQTKPGSASFVWLLSRTEEPMPEDGTIFASTDTIFPGHPEYDKIIPSVFGTNSLPMIPSPVPGSGEDTKRMILDLDVDSDNMHDGKVDGTAGDDTDPEGNTEKVAPGVVMLINDDCDRGLKDQNGKDKPDNQGDLIDKEKDDDLWVARLNINTQGEKGTLSWSIPNSVKLYWVWHGQLEEVRSGAAYDYSGNANIEMRMQGMDLDEGKIKVTFTPKGQKKEISDEVAFKVSRIIVRFSGQTHGGLTFPTAPPPGDTCGLIDSELGWFWGVEVKANLPLEESPFDWDPAQTVAAKGKAVLEKNDGTKVELDLTKDVHEDAVTEGQMTDPHHLYFIDSPGFFRLPLQPPFDRSTDSVSLLYSFSSCVKKKGMDKKLEIQWYLRLIVEPGRKLNNTLTLPSYRELQLPE